MPYSSQTNYDPYFLFVSSIILTLGKIIYLENIRLKESVIKVNQMRNEERIGRISLQKKQRNTINEEYKMNGYRFSVIGHVKLIVIL